ncbi:VCBS domain-containing protein [Umboniibacter marinipuniceus]|nr:VCBS domain-containing protein [Umboniibacter marinipuniceus]
MSVRVDVEEGERQQTGFSQSKTYQFNHISVPEFNTAPTVAASAAAPEGTYSAAPITITEAQLLAGVTDSDGDKLTVENVSLDPSNAGTLVTNSDNSVTFTPAGTFTGSPHIKFDISDGRTSVPSSTEIRVVEPAAITLESIDNGIEIETVVSGGGHSIHGFNHPGHGANHPHFGANTEVEVASGDLVLGGSVYSIADGTDITIHVVDPANAKNNLDLTATVTGGKWSLTIPHSEFDKVTGDHEFKYSMEATDVLGHSVTASTELLKSVVSADVDEGKNISLDLLDGVTGESVSQVEYSQDGSHWSTNVPDGFVLGSDGHTLEVDATNPAYNSLALGESQSIYVQYKVEQSSTGDSFTQRATLVVHGQPEKPVIQVLTDSGKQFGPAISGNLITGVGTLEGASAAATDVDAGSTLALHDVQLKDPSTGNYVTVTPSHPYTIAGQGTLAIDTDGSYTFTPLPGAATPFTTPTMTYRVVDTSHSSSYDDQSQSTFTIEVEADQSATITTSTLHSASGVLVVGIAEEDGAPGDSARIPVGITILDPDAGETALVTGISQGSGATETSASVQQIAGTQLYSLHTKYGDLHLTSDGTQSYFMFDNKAAQEIGPGQTVREVFHVQLTSSNGQIVTKDVEVDVVGKLDAPTVSVSAQPGAIHQDIDLSSNPELIEVLRGDKPDTTGFSYDPGDHVVLGLPDPSKAGNVDITNALPTGIHAFDKNGDPLQEYRVNGKLVGFEASCQDVIDGVSFSIPPSVTATSMNLAVAGLNTITNQGMNVSFIVPIQLGSGTGEFKQDISHNIGAIRAGDELDIKIELDAVDKGVSESMSAKLTGVPHGVVLHDDSGNSIRVNSPNQLISLKGWDLDHIHATVPAGLHNNAVVQLIATATAPDGSEESHTTVVPMVLNPNSPGEFSMSSPNSVTEGEVGKFTVNFFGQLGAGETASVLVKSHLDLTDIDLAKVQLPQGVEMVMDPPGSNTPQLIGGDYVYRVTFSSDGTPGPHLQQVAIGLPITVDSLVEHGEMITAQMIKDPGTDPKYAVTDLGIHRIAIQDKGASELIVKPEPGTDPHLFGEVPTDINGDQITWHSTPPIIGKYGVLVFEPNGQYSFIANSQSEAIKSMGEGDVGQQSFTVHGSTDSGKAVSHSINLNILGSNEAPTISGALELDRLVGGGTTGGRRVIVHDPDGDTFTLSLKGHSGNTIETEYSTFTLGKDGTWELHPKSTFTKDCVTADGVSHKAGDPITEVIDANGDAVGVLRMHVTVVATDSNGASSEMTITPVIVSPTGVGLEARGYGNDVKIVDGSDYDASGTIEKVEVSGQASLDHATFSLDQPKGAFGDFSIDSSTGDWKYTPDKTKVSELGASDHVTDSVTVLLEDSSHTPPIHSIFKLAVNLQGTDDLPKITGAHIEPRGSSSTSVEGAMQVLDPDTDSSLLSWEVDQSQGTHGHLIMDSEGHWQYHATDGDPVWQAGQPVHEQFIVTVLQPDGKGANRLMELELNPQGSVIDAKASMHDAPLNVYTVDATQYQIEIDNSGTTAKPGEAAGSQFLADNGREMAVQLPDGFTMSDAHLVGKYWVPDHQDAASLSDLTVTAPPDWAGQLEVNIVQTKVVQGKSTGALIGRSEQEITATANDHLLASPPPPPPPPAEEEGQAVQAAEDQSVVDVKIDLDELVAVTDSGPVDQHDGSQTTSSYLDQLGITADDVATHSTPQVPLDPDLDQVFAEADSAVLDSDVGGSDGLEAGHDGLVGAEDDTHHQHPLDVNDQFSDDSSSV